MTRQQAAVYAIQKAAMNKGNFDNFGGGANTQSRTVSLAGASQNQQAQFNIVIAGLIPATNIAASALSTISTELFYAQNSASKLGSQALNALLSQNQPIDGNIINLSSVLVGGQINPISFPGGGGGLATQFIRGYYQAAPAPSNWGNNPPTVCGFDNLGNLDFLLSTAAYTASVPYLSIGLRETSYRALFEYSAVHAFNISKIRITSTYANNGAQFQNTLFWAKATWLGGVNKQPVSPQSYVTPFQQQANIVDIVKTPFRIDRQKGFQYNINAGELPGIYNGTGVVLTCWCDLYTRSEL